jgi:hypothetical protein
MIKTTTPVRWILWILAVLVFTTVAVCKLTGSDNKPEKKRGYDYVLTMECNKEILFETVAHFNADGSLPQNAWEKAAIKTASQIPCEGQRTMKVIRNGETKWFARVMMPKKDGVLRLQKE